MEDGDRYLDRYNTKNVIKIILPCITLKKIHKVTFVFIQIACNKKSKETMSYNKELTTSITKTTICHTKIRTSGLKRYGKTASEKWLLGNSGLKSAVMKIPELNH